MKEGARSVIYDSDLDVEAYQFDGIMQKFPNHFHEYYVIGFIENGLRRLSCRNQEYIIAPGDLLLFNPHDNHTCEQIGVCTLEYRCLNIRKGSMEKAIFEITGKKDLPHFSLQVVPHSELVPAWKELHSMIMKREKDFKKEELFFFLLGQLIKEYAGQILPSVPAPQSAEIDAVCRFLEENFKSSVRLDDLAHTAGMSKYYLLRSFTKQKGLSPYCYLETVRIEKAKQMLQKGVPLIEAALQTGFSDQSHFSHFFKKLIGLTPKQYMDIFKDARIHSKTQ